ncbi:MAG: hypothetical protein E5V51_00070 [Mesorhizobium sp.]|nr:MAG: hypothetical protein E5V51_00070 [Mesorhizobium sp.]
MAEFLDFRIIHVDESATLCKFRNSRCILPLRRTLRPARYLQRPGVFLSSVRGLNCLALKVLPHGRFHRGRKEKTMRFHRLFGFVTLSFVSLVRAIEHWFSALRVDAKTALALEGVRRAARDAPGALSRMRAYMARALKHDCFTAGYFDPGRSAA